MPPTIVRSDNIAATALDLVRERLLQALDERGSATLVLSGGSTPVPLYRLLADSDLTWERIHLFWGDERLVPHDHEESNHGAARPELIDQLDSPAGDVHPWPILARPEASPDAYSDSVQPT